MIGRRRFLTWLAQLSSGALLCGNSAKSSETASSPLTWWYRSPAASFWEGLPLSNGRIAAMVYGGIQDELIPVNEASLWSGAPYNPVNPKGLPALPEIRRLLLNGQYPEAENLCESLMGVPKVVQHYQPLGELRVRFHPSDTVATGYRRELDMDSAVARVSYTVDGVRYFREIFTSYPDRVLVMRLTADKPAMMHLAIRLASVQPSAHSHIDEHGAIVMNGMAETVTKDKKAIPIIPAKIRWQAQLRAIPSGGNVTDERIEGDEDRTSACISVKGADTVTVVFAAATNYVHWNDISADPAERVTKFIEAAERSYDVLLARHLTDWQPQFRSCSLDLGGADAHKEDTTTRLDKLRQGAKDLLFTTQYFQYGRYLLLCDSRPGTLPFNNHNVWLDKMNQKWRGRWTLNINLQECYWPSESTGLPQTNEALLEFVEQLAESGSRTARELYGCRGWVSHHGTDVWMNTCPTDATHSGIWPTSGPWLLQQLWEHYLFEPDMSYLRRIYPLLKGSSQFFLDFLMEGPKNGWLVTAPSVSPENSFFTPERKIASVCMGPTLDNALLRDLFSHTAEAGRLLAVDASFQAKLESTRDRLPPDRIGKHGQIEEWLEDFDEPEVTHRHLSPLYGFYPSNQITMSKTPRLVEGCRVTLNRRGYTNRGWSGAWKINILARLRDAERASALLAQMLTEFSIQPSKVESDRVPSFDGNQGIQGITAGIAEVLLQSHDQKIELLPALPSAWPAGRVAGLRARGGFVVDISWRRGKLTQVRLKSMNGKACVLSYAGKTLTFKTEAGRSYLYDGILQTI